jgi:hypothetical protein
MFLLLAVGESNIKPVVSDALDGASLKLGTVDLTQFNSFCGHQFLTAQTWVKF